MAETHNYVMAIMDIIVKAMNRFGDSFLIERFYGGIVKELTPLFWPLNSLSFAVFS